VIKISAGRCACAYKIKWKLKYLLFGLSTHRIISDRSLILQGMEINLKYFKNIAFKNSLLAI